MNEISANYVNRRDVVTRDLIGILHITTVPITLNFIKRQVAYLKARGLTVSILSSPGEQLDAFAKSQQVQAYAVDMPRRITPLRDLRSIFQIWIILRRIRPKVVHSHTPKGGLLGTISAWLAGVPVRIYHMRGLPYMTAHGYRRLLLVLSEKVSCRLAHRVFCISPSLREVAIRDHLCAPEKIQVLANGSSGTDAAEIFNPSLVEPHRRAKIREECAIPSGNRVIGFVGRLVRDKGIIELITAWGSLREEHPDLHLLLVGPFESQDPLPPEVEKQICQDPCIHRTGLVLQDIPILYSLMDVFVLPTYREGFPNAPMEAAAMELPVVATRIPGCVDAVQDGITGTLVPPYDAEALAAAVRRYLDDPDLRRIHGQAGRARVLRDFNPRDIWEATYHEYKQLLSAKGISLDS